MTWIHVVLWYWMFGAGLSLWVMPEEIDLALGRYHPVVVALAFVSMGFVTPLIIASHMLRWVTGRG